MNETAMQSTLLLMQKRRFFYPVAPIRPAGRALGVSHWRSSWSSRGDRTPRQCHPAYEDDPDQSTTPLDLLLSYSAVGVRQIDDNDFVNISINDGRMVRVSLPPGTYGSSGNRFYLLIWIGEDGSTFWGRRSPNEVTFDHPDQDAEYAFRFDNDRPAKSSNDDGGNPSTAIDQGSAGSASPYATTSTGLTPDTSNNDDLDLGYHYNGSVTP